MIFSSSLSSIKILIHIVCYSLYISHRLKCFIVHTLCSVSLLFVTWVRWAKEYRYGIGIVLINIYPFKKFFIFFNPKNQ